MPPVQALGVRPIQIRRRTQQQARPTAPAYSCSMTVPVEQLAELDAIFFRVAGHWPDRPRLDPVLVAKSRELAEALLEANQP
jgi:hypothetical protein